MKMDLLMNRAYWLSLFVAVCLLAGCNSESASNKADDGILGLADPLSARDADPKLQNSKPADLSLKLKPGMRIPLKKTVQQELSQSSIKGVKKSTSSLELMMAITVDEIRENDKKFDVQYSHVKYSQNLDNKSLSYDSAIPNSPVPTAALPYQGMINNGFEFWVGQDNQIKEILGYEQFLDKCLAKIPEAQKQQLMMQIAASSQHDGLANFIDDTIGLLPYDEKAEKNGTVVNVGFTWTRRRYLNQPLPITVEQTYTIKEINDKVALLDMTGAVLPTTSLSKETYDGLNVQIRGGNSYGQCTIDLATGLPTQSQVDQYIDMLVALDGGITFEQRKHILTTVNAYPPQANQAIQQVGHELRR
jgi:hypothetical protein